MSTRSKIRSFLFYLNPKYGNLNLALSINITLWGNFMDLYWTFKSTFIRTAHFFFEEEKKIVISAVLESKITLLRTTLISWTGRSVPRHESWPRSIDSFLMRHFLKSTTFWESLVCHRRNNSGRMRSSWFACCGPCLTYLLTGRISDIVKKECLQTQLLLICFICLHG